jgi:molecular chaperone GrpE
MIDDHEGFSGIDDDSTGSDFEPVSGQAGSAVEGSPEGEPATAGSEALGAESSEAYSEEGGSASSEDPELQGIVQHLERLQAERDEFLDTLKRLQADFDNYKKRVARQEADMGQRAVRSLIAKLLPALDTLQLALAHAASDNGSPEAASALSQVSTVLMELLTKEGLEVIEPIGKRFDPTEAEAVAHEAGEGEPVVSEVFRVGYRWRGQTIRPAMVKVTGS